MMPSLLPRAHAQSAANNMRFVQFISSYGQYGQHFYPSDQGLVAVNGTQVKMLAGIQGDVSRIFGPAFSNFKTKMSLLRGMHVLAASNLHNGSMPTCSSSTPEDNEGNGRPFFSYSIDGVIAESAKIYPDPTGKQRFVNFCPSPGSYRNFSWTVRNGAKEHIANTTTTSALLSKFSSLGPPAPSAVEQRKVDVIQNVFGDYKKLRDSGKLSTEDRRRLEAYVALIDQVQKNLAASPNPSCRAPMQEADNSSAAMHRNQAAVLAAAIACGQTRVASYVLSVPYEPIHTYSHDFGKNIEHADMQKELAGHLAYFMTLLDQMPDVNGGSVLDNTLIYWGNEYGENSGGDPHRPDNMTAMIAGATSKLQLGYYVDYRKTGSVPFNNFMVTLANVMGLSSSDYEREGIAGFGEYNAAAIARYKFENATSTAERRKALPFIYKGPIMG
jgi:hypothetical protein